MTKTQGLSLADIGRLHEDVPVGEGYIRVHGISAKQALALVNAHPEVLVKAMQGGGIKFNDVIKAAPEVVAKIIAFATGGTDEEADEVPIEIQMDILEAVGRLTFSKGFGPFVQRIMALAGAADQGSVNSGVVPDTKSPAESNS